MHSISVTGPCAGRLTVFYFLFSSCPARRRVYKNLLCRLREPWEEPSAALLALAPESRWLFHAPRPSSEGVYGPCSPFTPLWESGRRKSNFGARNYDWLPWLGRVVLLVAAVHQRCSDGFVVCRCQRSLPAARLALVSQLADQPLQHWPFSFFFLFFFLC